MYLSPDDAKSDVILAGATVAFGGFARSIVAQLPLYPRQGVVALLLDLFWILALTALVPWLLSRYRGDHLAAFGLQQGPTGLGFGLLLAVPVVVAQVLAALVAGSDTVGSLSGRLEPLLTFGSELEGGGLALVVLLAQFLFLSVGAILLTSFLAVRSREAFVRSPETSLTQLLRTFGMGAAAVGLVLGLALSLRTPAMLPGVLLNAGALAAIVLLADRRVPARGSVPRATVIGPAAVTLIVHVFAAGGLFGGGLVDGLYLGAFGAGIAVVVATLVQVRALAWAVVPLLVAAHWWPSLLSPLSPVLTLQ